MSTKLKRKRILTVVIAIFSLALFVFWGLHIAMCMSDKDCNVLEGLIYGIVSVCNNPIAVFTAPIKLDYLCQSIITVLLIYGLIALVVKIDSQRHKHFEDGIECGSAKWNDDYDTYNKKYSDPPGSTSNNGPNNMILTQNVQLNMDGRKTLRNNNIAIVGGSGSGKSRFFVKPNILQANCNYVITDPAGELLKSTGHFLESSGYEIKIFNLVEMAKSDCYNPFDYIRDELGVVMMIKCLIKNTTPPGHKAGDPFWEKSEEALLQALCFYLVKYRPKEQRNFTTVMKLLRAAEINEDNPNQKSPLDRLFDQVAKTDPDSIALKQYKTFKMGAGKTLKSILISCSVRLTVFNLKQIENLTGRDTIDLEKMGEGKKALFVIIPSADSTYNFLVSMMYSQLFETLYFLAETKYPGNKLPSRVRFLLDEFANIGEIPEFTKKLSTMRKYEISCSIILQNIAQLKTMYKDDWQTVLGNCDSFLFLGGQEYETVEYISKELGDSTIVVRDRSMSFGKSKSSSQSYRRSSRKLMTPDELMHIDEDTCVLLIRALDPFKDKKYDYTQHPNYKKTGDADKKYCYINKKNNHVFESIEIIDIKNEQEKTEQYKNAVKNPSPSTKVIGEIKNEKGLCKSLNIKNNDELRDRLVVIEPDTETTPYAQPIVEDIASAATQEDKIMASTEYAADSETETNIPLDDDVNKNTCTDATSNDADNQKTTNKAKYPYNPSEKTQMRNSRVSFGSFVPNAPGADQAELWDFDNL